MNITCPACQAQINAKPPKPGSYKPKCPKCGTTFQLIVPDNPDATVVVRSLEASIHDVTLPSHPASESLVRAGVATSSEATQELTGGYTPEEYSASESHDEVTRTLGTPEQSQGHKQATAKKKQPAELQKIPEQLQGYLLSKQLGAGGMGAVYLAKQLSLDRNVALKVMHANWAQDPIFLARFTREAYAAAQLSHHNVVQIYDIGADAGINFFSMEYVVGKSLGDVLKRNGKLDPEIAVGYIIQAAKGLKFAHDRGMVHRDIKPDNLMLNTEGIIKVADLGLVKTSTMTAADDVAQKGASPGTGATSSAVPGQPSKLQSVSKDVTNAGLAMGTPSYMAPEQCRDAASVDHRADIYSLGCTLFALLSGRTPFQGKTAFDVMEKHLHEEPPALDTIEASVPKSLSAIVAKSLRKNPEERYSSMDEFIADLRQWQESTKQGPPKPTQEQITVFEGLTKQLANQSLAKLGATLSVVLPLVGLLLGFTLLFVKSAVGVALLVSVPAGLLSAVIVAGLVTNSELFTKLRAWLFGGRIVDWLTLAAAGLVFLVGLYLAGYFVAGLAGLVLGALVGAGFAWGIERTIYRQRQAARQDFISILKRLRLAGMDEDAVRDFVVLTAGDEAENVFDCIYGPQAKRALRAEFQTKGEDFPTFQQRQDRLVAKLDAVIEARQQRQARKHLEKLEKARLQAEGLSVAEATEQASQAAEDLVEQAAVIKASNIDKTKPVNMKAILTRYELAQLRANQRPRRKPFQILMNRLQGLIFNPQLRVALGLGLVLLGLLWVNQNAKSLEATTNAVSGLESIDSTDAAKQKAFSFFEVLNKANTKPLRVSFLPPNFTGWVDSVNPLVAGLILIVSAFSANTIAIVVMMMAAVVSVVLPRLGIVPPVEPLTPSHLTALACIALAAMVLFFFGRRQD